MVAAHQTADSPLLAAALAYAARGWRVFPLAPNSKVPLIPKSRGGHGLLDASDVVWQIRSWWGQYPQANIGVACGHGLVVIDEDLYKGANLDEWILPPTLTARSPRGGQHRYFTYAGELRSLPENQLAPGVCIKAQGGYVVAAPSRFQGRTYDFLDPDQPIAELPERIAELIRRTSGSAPASPQQAPAQAPAPAGEPRSSADHWLQLALAKTRDGEGDLTGFWLAQQLLANGCADSDSALATYARQATVDQRHPFGDRDIERWKRSAAASRIVQRGEPARSPTGSQRTTPVVMERPHHAKKTAEHAKSVTESEQSVTDRAESVTDDDEQPADAESEAQALLRFSADDKGNAEAMRLLYGRELLYSPVYGWMQWSETHWRAVPDAIVMRYVIAALTRRRHAAVDAGNETIVKVTAGSHARVRGCMALFMAYVIEPDAKTFDADPDALNCLNGVVNLRTGRITPHQSSQRYTYCLTVPYDPQANTPAWEAFITEAIGGDADVARYLQLCAGYALTGHTKDEKVFYLYGPTRAGKGVFTETLLALLPTPLSTEVDFTTFTAIRDADAQNFDLAGLKPARIVFASESNRRQKLNPARMKQFSGGNQIHCAFKHRDMFTYRPQFSVWLVSNHPINADADDDALWGRLHVIEFPHSHLGREDTTLKDRMKVPENLRGVLAWMVAGARRWYQERALIAPARVVEATAAQRDEQDYVRQWMDECCALEPASDWLSSARLYGSYQAWCKDNALMPMRPNELGETLRKRFKVRPKRQAKTGARGYIGIALTSDGQQSLWEQEVEG